MKMTYQELRKLWEKARDAVAGIHAPPCMELGNGLRARGYDVTYDGCSVCHFREKRLAIRYGADCCDHAWKIYGILKFDDTSGETHTLAMEESQERFYGKADSEAVFDVAEFLSVAERFDRGDLKCESGFGVVEYGEGRRKIIGEFSDFDKADECARKACRRVIDGLNCDATWRRHTPPCVRNDEQLARERDDLRCYPTYNYYDGHRYWISVEMKL